MASSPSVGKKRKWSERGLLTEPCLRCVGRASLTLTIFATGSCSNSKVHVVLLLLQLQGERQRQKKAEWMLSETKAERRESREIGPFPTRLSRVFGFSSLSSDSVGGSWKPLLLNRRCRATDLAGRLILQHQPKQRQPSALTGLGFESQSELQHQLQCGRRCSTQSLTWM